MESPEAGPLLDIGIESLGNDTAEALIIESALVWHEGRDDRGWLTLCVPPGPTLEISVTVVACENPRRVNKLSIVRQTTGLMKVYVNVEAFCRETGRGMEEWAIEGHSVRLVIGTPARLLPTSEAEL